MKKLLTIKEPTTIYILGTVTEQNDYGLTDDYCTFNVKIKRERIHKQVAFMQSDGFFGITTDKAEVIKLVEKQIHDHGNLDFDVFYVKKYQGDIFLVGINEDTDTSDYLAYLPKGEYTFEDEDGIYNDDEFYVLLDPSTNETFMSLIIETETDFNDILEILNDVQ